MVAIDDTHCLFKSGLGVEVKHSFVMIQINTFKANDMVDIVKVDSLDSPDRGGFGSTGTN